MIKSCKDCTERQVGCHAICEKYLSEKAEYDKLQKSIRDIKDRRSDIDSAVHENIKRMKRGRR